MVNLIFFCFSILFLLSGLVIMLTTRRRMVAFTQSLIYSLDSLISGKQDFSFEEDKDTLLGKVQVKMRCLYELIEERAAKNQAERLLLEQNIGDLSHQIKTPISSIHMYHSLLLKDTLSAQSRKEFLTSMEYQVNKLDFLIQSMIKMSRLETGIVKVHSKTQSVYALIEQAVCDVALKAEEKEIDIQVACPERTAAYFDFRWSLEALFNLLDNAVKYTSKGGHIQIDAKVTDFFVRISVKDNGRGISEDHQTEIFKRFYREPEAAQTEGVGIGLYISREIALKQKGFLEVRSQKGLGSTFSLHLPIKV